METIKFKDCSCLLLEKKVGLEQIDNLPLLDNWLEKSVDYQVDAIEQTILNKLQDHLKYRVNDWNEMELIEHFIAPLFSIVDFNTRKYGMFSCRPISATINDISFTGEPDAIIAKGRRAPEIPYFCFNEYKKEEEAKGDSIGQCLAAMLVAQEMNNNSIPIYGVVVKGLMWRFMLLQGKEYAITKGFQAIDDDIFDIVKMLKHLKTIIEEYING